MNYLTVCFLIFAFMQMNILGNAKCRKKGQVSKQAADKSKETQGIKKNNITSQDSPTNEVTKPKEASDTQENVPYDLPSADDAIKEDDKTKQTNATQTGRFNLPTDFSYPKEFGLPTDSNSPGQPDQSREEAELGYHGNLYDVFKKRLDQVFRELYYNVNSPGVTAPPPQIEYETDKPKKRSAVSNCLYEEFKRRLDKFNNEFMEPAKAIKRTSSESTGVSGSGKRSTVQENLYEEYKRRLDKLGNELWFDGEKVFDRSGREAPGKLPFINTKPEYKPKRSETDKAAQQDFYEEYKKKLDQLTRELYQKSNERICRTYTQLTAEDLTSPTLQRLVEAVQLDEAKSMKGDTRDAPGSFEGSNILLKIDKAIDNLDKQEDKRSLGADDLGTTIFGADSLNFMTGASNGVGATAAASYPAVLTKTVDANLGLLGTAPKNMLATVASKMNMTTLDLAKKLAAMSNPLDYVAKSDPQLGEEVQKLIDFSISNKLNQNPTAKKSPVHEVSVVAGLPLLGPDSSGVPTPLMMQDALFGAIPALAPASVPAPAPAPAPAPTSSVSPASTAASAQPQDPSQPKPATKSPPVAVSGAAQSSEAEAMRIAGVLDKVLGKLEHMQQCRTGVSAEPADDNCEPDGITCDVVGSWNSYAMGLRFDIALSKAADRRLGMAEKNNQLLTIDVGERVPPKAHHILDTSWKFMGSALNQQGGPFYFYTQNRELNTVATFIGYCRVCDGIDTIFGSWTIMEPSKDCQDVTTSLENRRDIFRRYNMESKRNKHFKDMLFEKSKYSKPECKDNKNG